MTCDGNRVLRLLPDGRRDPSFGRDGLARVDFTGGVRFLVVGADSHDVGVGPRTYFYDTPLPDFSLAWYFGR